MLPGPVVCVTKSPEKCDCIAGDGTLSSRTLLTAAASFWIAFDCLHKQTNETREADPLFFLSISVHWTRSSVLGEANHPILPFWLLGTPSVVNSHDKGTYCVFPFLVTCSSHEPTTIPHGQKVHDKAIVVFRMHGQQWY